MLYEEDTAHFLGVSYDGKAGGEQFLFSRDALAAGPLDKGLGDGIDNGGARRSVADLFHEDAKTSDQ